MARIQLKHSCPFCGNASIIAHASDSFFSEDWIDIPAHCPKCKAELRVLYKFEELTLDT